MVSVVTSLKTQPAAGAPVMDVACGAGFVLLAGEVVEDVVGVALAAAGLLVDEREDAGEGGCGDRGAAVAGEVVGGRSEAAGLAVGVGALLADDVEGAEEASAGEERDVGGVADTVGGDAGAGLPGGLGDSLRGNWRQTSRWTGCRSWGRRRRRRPREARRRLRVRCCRPARASGRRRCCEVLKTELVQLSFQGVSGM